LLLLLLVLGAGQWLFERYWLGQQRHYQDATEQLQDHLLRYRRLAEQRPLLEQKLGEVQQNDAIEAYYLAQETPVLAATELQRRAGQAVQKNGGSLTSSQVLPVEDDSGFARVAIRVQMNGDMDALSNIFHTLESARPTVMVDNVQIRARPIRQRVPRATTENNRRKQYDVKTEIQLTAQFELVGFMPKRRN
jgi:general secretion pathway protein M